MEFSVNCDSEGQSLSFSKFPCEGRAGMALCSQLPSRRAGLASLTLNPEPAQIPHSDFDPTRSILSPSQSLLRHPKSAPRGWSSLLVMSQSRMGLEDPSGMGSSPWKWLWGRRDPLGTGNAKPAVPKILPEQQQQQHHGLSVSS